MDQVVCGWKIGQAQYTDSDRSGTSTIIEDHQVIYEQVPGRQRWLRWEPSLLIADNRVIGPGQMLSFLKGVSGPIHEVGPAQQRGVPVRHLRTTIDPMKLVTEVEGPDTARQLGAAGVQPFPTDIYVDDEGRVRRLELSMRIELPGELKRLAEQAGMAADMSREFRFSADYWDFGVPVEVRVPDPSQVQPGGRQQLLPR